MAGMTSFLDFRQHRFRPEDDPRINVAVTAIGGFTNLTFPRVASVRRNAFSVIQRCSLLQLVVNY